MLHVAIVGDHGAGKATFLGFVYTALVSSGSGREDALRFRVSYDSLDEIAGLFQRLMSGGFPDSTTKEGLHELTLELDVARPGRGILQRLGSRHDSREIAKTIRFSLPGSLGEDSSGLHQGSTFGTGRWRDALDADVVAVLADSTRLAPRAADAREAPLAAYDRRVEALFVSIQRWRSSGGRSLLHPVFVLTKFDSVRSEVLKAASLEPSAPSVGKLGPRSAYAAALLEPNLPRTLAMVRGPIGKKLRFAPPSYVFSGVRTESKDAGPSERIRLRRTKDGGWEPDYSRAEYVAFLERITEIAAATKD